MTHNSYNIIDRLKQTQFSINKRHAVGTADRKSNVLTNTPIKVKLHDSSYETLRVSKNMPRMTITRAKRNNDKKYQSREGIPNNQASFELFQPNRSVEISDRNKTQQTFTGAPNSKRCQFHEKYDR